MVKILFVCHGNICRSTMAEFVMKDMVKKAGVEKYFYIESAATTDEEIGNPVYPNTRRKLAEHGISCEGKTARQMTRADYAKFDMIIGMDDENLHDMRRICGGDPDGKISLLLDHTDHPRDVADPWYTRNFDETWVDVNEGCRAVLEKCRRDGFELKTTAGGGVMPVINGLGWTFDTVASTYEKFRPGYTAELYEKMFEYRPIGRSSRLVEVGIGAGQATLPFLQTGCSLTAVDPGEHFAELCKEKFGEFSGFRVMTGKFEELSFEDAAYDLVYSASAFHWVPEDVGYRKVFAMLKSGGAFARFANHPYQDKGRPALAEEIQNLYGAYYNKFHKIERSAPKEYDEEQAAQRAETARKYGFADITYALFRRTRTFTAKEYVALLGTYSDHIVMKEKMRTEFFAKIEEAIVRHGGEITIYDTIDLQLAGKP